MCFVVVPIAETRQQGGAGIGVTDPPNFSVTIIIVRKEGTLSFSSGSQYLF